MLGKALELSPQALVIQSPWDPPRPWDRGGAALVPWLEQWTMATPVNTLCSFPFSLQQKLRPCAWNVWGGS